MLPGHQEVDHVQLREYLVAIGGNGDVAFAWQPQARLACSRRKVWGLQTTRRGAAERSDHV